MPTINEVDFTQASKDALAAAKAVLNDNIIWDSLKDIIKNLSSSITNDVELIAKRKLSGEFNEDDARAYIEDQKTIASIRIRSIAVIGLQLAENIWNAIANVFGTAINKALGWTLL